MSQPEKKTFDLADLDTAAASEQGAELELVHPATGEPLGMYITLAGSDSQTWRSALYRNMEGRNGRQKKTPEQVLAENINIYAACTLGWRNVVLDGQQVPFSTEEARKLYRRYPWIREQADAFIGERANFLRS